ncbi:MAG: N-6 DNA methylase [Myxococcales bacterium]|nr:N-6 DNA methylase [Myxococcales bacterium]
MASQRTLAQITDSLATLSKRVSPATFLFDFLECFGIPKATLARLKSGNLNVAKVEGAFLLKDRVYFEAVSAPPKATANRASDANPRWGRRAVRDAGQSLVRTPTAVIEQARIERSVTANRPRFLISTDFKTVAAFDTKLQEATEFDISDLHDQYTFFLPLAGMERAVAQPELEADVRAAEHMAKLYDLIRADNPPRTVAERHALNVFLTRLLFCYFAEDTGIFPKASFTSALKQYTQEDGSDVAEFLGELFMHLSTDHGVGSRAKAHFREFPYVNGGLFSDSRHASSTVPRFSAKSRRQLLALGDKDWNSINPDIFGSMFQAVVDDGKRSELGMHYTSVPNIMKVIGPLFLDELHAEFNRARGSKAKLERLLQRLPRLRFFDPACGSGNFLIIAYKELRKLEMLVFTELLRSAAQLPMALCNINVNQFYGIEIDDFACEVALLGLWLAEHQMNIQFESTFGKRLPSLPLKDGARIRCANATQVEWADVCPKTEGYEIYVLGNPPYLGARMQGKEQRADVERCYGGAPDHRDADLISCWFLKGAGYLRGTAYRLAFVTTNSVCQGDHVAILWPRIFEHGLEIFYAHTSFKWANSAKRNAGVTCVIVGLRAKVAAPKWIFENGVKSIVSNINAYLAQGSDTVIGRRAESLSGFPTAVMGSMARDGGHLILSTEEKDELLATFPHARELVRKFIGAEEFLYSAPRWCLWISDAQLALANSIPPVAKRIAAVRAFRKASSAKTTNGYASIAHQFAQRAHRDGAAIVLPRTSSERRQYIPFGLLDSDSIVSDAASVVYGASLDVFAVLSSRMHMVWVRTVAGRLEDRIRYSSLICYNNFPCPELDDSQRKSLVAHAEALLLARERYPDRTIADLYDPDAMPAELLSAHGALDRAVEGCYQAKPFISDAQRLAHLFALYEAMAAADAAKEPLPPPAARSRPGNVTKRKKGPVHA